MPDYRAEVTLKRPDNAHTAKRTVRFWAHDLEAAKLMLPEICREGGYTGYRLFTVKSIEETP